MTTSHWWDSDPERQVVIASAVRTAFGRFGGLLKDVSAVDLAAHVMKACVDRVDLDASELDEIYLGVCSQAETGTMAPVVARQALLRAGFPPKTVSMTLDRACCSSLAAVQLAGRAVRCGDASLVLAGGAENMSRVPLQLDASVRWGTKVGHLALRDELFTMSYPNYNPVSVDAGQVAVEHDIGREEQDRWALLSQQRYAQAQAEGKFECEIVPITVQGRRGESVVVDQDESPRPDTSMEKLERLKTVYGSPTVTAGNAPGLNAGAAMVLVTSRAEAERRDLTILAEVLSVASVAMEPRLIAEVPAPAIQAALDQAGLKLDDVALFEINEAFAAMPLVASKLLAGGDPDRTQWIRDRLNVNGGAVAIGHPVGASGARILLTMIYELMRRGGGLGACAICGGLAQGDAAVVRVPRTKS
ncbi:MAG: thiolase family protein [Deltaproteobacteria bacterium]|nr:thiolase family protein [Deltaproteobacteria bacterium]